MDYCRIRPQGSREKLEGSRVCTSVIFGQPQVTIGGDRSFTYDYVFDQETSQITVYESCIEKLVEGLFDGFNATVLAYGQTGSGKTHTMGTAFDTGSTAQTDVGVIPRSISHVFQKVSDLKKEAHEGGLNEPTFDVSVQFIELYNEEIIDLLADDRTSSLNVRIHEDSRGEISLHGVTGRQVQDLNSTLNILKNGALNRTVASTNMNEQSSRSHAIFSLHIRQQRVIFAGDNEIQSSVSLSSYLVYSYCLGEMEMELLSAKFHFVDLAGSERLKRTGATGDRAKEGISINCGLLALGNVISALGGAHGKVSHVPYRDSKLTRLLQDSLGGNRIRFYDFHLDLFITVVANQDKSSKLIGELRGRISALESELLEFKQGRRTIGGDGVEAINDQYHENVMLTILRNRNVQLIAVRDLDTLDSTLSNSRGEYEILSSGKCVIFLNVILIENKCNILYLCNWLENTQSLYMLISELERSERRLAEVRITYEKKLTELSLRIKQTEAERDRILASGAEKKMDKASQEQAKKIREEYERKLSDMRNEFRKLQLVEKEHKRMQARQERERQELMRYQCISYFIYLHMYKYCTYIFVCRKKDNLIRQLESKDRQREQYIRRNNEEMNRLRKAQKDQAKQAR
uniref:Kinesin-like protein n=1 Tax=Heterorhabditis bacteriophora TaxID=37862 RepID=A0A1I7WYE6_HETBA